MNLRRAIERVRSGNGHERLGLGIEMAQFPEIEEGAELVDLLHEVLCQDYEGRMVSWSVERVCADRRVMLKASAWIQSYRDLRVIEKPLQMSLPDGRIRQVELSSITPRALAGEQLFGWELSGFRELLQAAEGLLCLEVGISSNREVWTTPKIMMSASVVRLSEGGSRMVLVDVTDEILFGGLEKTLARILANNVLPAIDQQIGARAFGQGLVTTKKS